MSESQDPRKPSTVRPLRIIVIAFLIVVAIASVSWTTLIVERHLKSAPASAETSSGDLPKPSNVQLYVPPSDETVPPSSEVPTPQYAYASDENTPPEPPTSDETTPPADTNPWPDKDNTGSFNDTVCSVGITAGGPKLLTVSRIMPTVPDIAHTLVVGDKGLFTEGIRNNGHPTITNYSARLDDTLQEPGSVNHCNYPNTAIDPTRISNPPVSIASAPSTVCIVTYVDPTDVALTLSDGNSYIASSDTNKYVLPGDNVQLSTTDGASVNVDGYNDGDFTSACQALVLPKTADYLTPPTS